MVSTDLEAIMGPKHEENVNVTSLFNEVYRATKEAYRPNVVITFMNIYRGSMQELKEVTSLSEEELENAGKRMHESVKGTEDEDPVLLTLLNFYSGNMNRLVKLTKIPKKTINRLKKARVHWKKQGSDTIALRQLEHLFRYTGTYDLEEALSSVYIGGIIRRERLLELSSDEGIPCKACGHSITEKGVIINYKDGDNVIPDFQGFDCASKLFRISHISSIAQAWQILSERIKRAETEDEPEYVLIKDEAQLKKVLTAKDILSAKLQVEYRERLKQHEERLYVKYVEALQSLEEAVGDNDRKRIYMFMQRKGMDINQLEIKAKEKLGSFAEDVVRKYKAHSPLADWETALLVSLYNSEIYHPTDFLLGALRQEVGLLINEKKIVVIERSEDREIDNKKLNEIREQGKIALFSEDYETAMSVMRQKEITFNDYLFVFRTFSSIEEIRRSEQARIHTKYHENPDEVYLTVFKTATDKKLPQSVKGDINRIYTDYTVGPGSVRPDAKTIFDHIFFTDLLPERKKSKRRETTERNRLASRSLVDELRRDYSNSDETDVFADKLFRFDKWNYRRQLDRLQEDGTLEWLSDVLWLGNIKTRVFGAISGNEYAKNYKNLVTAYRVLTRA